jgi:PhnB protein
MATINPYLSFNGNTAEVFNFYKAVFGGEFAMVARYGDMPQGADCEGMKLADADKDRIMHIALPIGGNVLMGSDIIEAMGQGRKFTEGDNFSVSISADNKEEADRLFGALSEGGKVEMPIADSPWGSYFGMFRDKFGIQWMVDYDARSVKK